MKKLIALFALLLLVGCSSPGYQKLDQEEAYNQLSEDESIILVDVRELSEYQEGHIEGAILLPVGKIDELALETLPDKEAVIYVYCRSGNRSKTAANKLIELGYTNVFDIGGISTWEYGIVK